MVLKHFSEKHRIDVCVDVAALKVKEPKNLQSQQKVNKTKVSAGSEQLGAAFRVLPGFVLQISEQFSLRWKFSQDL